LQIQLRRKRTKSCAAHHMFSRKINSKLSTSSQKVLLVFFVQKTCIGIFKKNANFRYIFNHFFKKENAQNVHGILPRNGLFKVQIKLRRNKINKLFTTCFSSKLFIGRKTPIATKVQTSNLGQVEN